MTTVAHRPSAREAMLSAVEAHLRTEGSLSLDSAARAAGVSKPGLMYHFATKEDLMTALLDRVVARYVDGLGQALADEAGTPDPAETTVWQRLRAYVTWTCASEFDGADLVMFTDPRLREPLTQRWNDLLEPWLTVPPRLRAADRSRLLAARLMADGVWFASASGTLPLTAAQRRGVRDVALGLLAAP